MIERGPRVLKTLLHTDPDFLKYLDGSFSDVARALPVRSLNVGTGVEQVTFEIIPRDRIESPNILLTLISLARPSSSILSIGPLVATYLFCWSRGLAFSQAVALSSALGVLLFHIAANLFNDYGDHLRGRDRLRQRGGSRVIQKGWLSARTVRRTAWLAAGASLVCGLPAILQPASEFSPLWIVVGIAALAILEFAFQKLRLKARGWAEILAFLLMGPLLTLGFSWAICGRLFWAQAVLGAVFGSQALMYYHSVNFENIMADSQAKVQTWATRAGFDASKKFFYFTAILSSFCLFVYAGVFEGSPWFAGVVMIHVGCCLQLCERVHYLASPLSSRLMGLRRSVLITCWITAFVLSLAMIVLAGTGRAW